MLNKDITHPKMRRRIENPRIVLLDCTLEYKKGESQTNIEISKEEDWNRILQIEEEQIKVMCDAIMAVKPDRRGDELSHGLVVIDVDGQGDLLNDLKSVLERALESRDDNDGVNVAVELGQGLCQDFTGCCS